MHARLLVLAIAVAGVIGTAAPAAAQAPIIDNARVTVWDVTSAPLPDPRGLDTVTIELAPTPGVARFHRGGAGRPAAAAAGQRLVQIAFKDATVAPLPNRSGHADAFPRPRSVTVFENDRLRINDYTWNPGEPTPVHFHPNDVVVVYLDNGSLRSDTLDGKQVVNDYTMGTIRFNLRDRVHSEVLVKGRQRAILVELK